MILKNEVLKYCYWYAFPAQRPTPIPCVYEAYQRDGSYIIAWVFKRLSRVLFFLEN